LADFARFIFRSVDFMVLAIKAHLILFIACCLVFTSLGFLYARMKGKYFQTEMIVQQSSLTKKTYYEIIHNLDQMIKTKSYEDLACALGVEKHAACQLLSLSASNLSNESLEKDTSTKAGLPFKIRVRTSENVHLPELQSGIVNYLNNIPYAKQKREGQKKILNEKLSFIEQEQKKLDSLKETYNHSLAGMKQPASFFNNALNPAELYEHSLNLASQKESIQNWMNTEGNGIMLSDGFKIPANPKSPSTIFLVLIGLVAGVLAGMVLSLLAEFRKRFN
jgi:hypothetical protein